MPCIMNHEVRFKCTKNQLDLIRNKAISKGTTIAEYCRDRSVGDSLILEHQVAALYAKFCESKKAYEISKTLAKDPSYDEKPQHTAYKSDDEIFGGIGELQPTNTKSTYTGEDDYNGR